MKRRPARSSPRAWWRSSDGGSTSSVASLSFSSRGVTPEAVEQSFFRGDNRERQAVLKSLPLLADPPRFVALGVEACRTSVEDVFRAIACDNPFPARYFAPAAFNQMVLKAIFNGIPVSGILGLDAHVTPELLRMADPRRGAPRRRTNRARRHRAPPRVRREKEVMEIFDPHIHMTSRTTDDYEAMAAAGHRGDHRAGVLARPAAHQPRLVRRLLRRADRLGALPRRPVRDRAPLHDGAEPEGGQRRGAGAGSARRAAALPGQGRRRRGRRDRLRRDDRRPRRRAFAAQLELAAEHEMPVLVHTPHRDKRRGTERTHGARRSRALDPSKRADRPQQRAHDAPASCDRGCWAGFTIYPDTKMDERAHGAIVQKLGAGAHPRQLRLRLGRQSDPLKVPKDRRPAAQGGISEEAIRREDRYGQPLPSSARPAA